MTGRRPLHSSSPCACARVEDGDACDLRIHAAPASDARGELGQFRSMASGALATLRAQGFVSADVAAGWAYLARTPSFCWRTELALAWGESDPERLPLTFLVQPPATPRRFCEMHLHAVRPRSDRCSVVWRGSPHTGGPLSTTVLRRGARHVHLLSVTPQVEAGDRLDLADAVVDVLARASHALRDRGLSFHDVVRTWIYLPDMRGYPDLNRGRNRFFAGQELARLPASTGIAGALVGSRHTVALDLYAVGRTGSDSSVDTMHASCMAEAPAYGSSFARGLLVSDPGRRLAYLSGTASIDERGEVVAPRDARGQMRRMFANAGALLAGCGLSLADTLCATVYLKRPGYLAEFRAAARRFALPPGTPCAAVVAEICRPEWLCEIELVAGRVG